jgi:glutamine amidotransferase-like uncharacterized protein
MSHLVKLRCVQLISCIAALALPGCAPPELNDATAILLFNGNGASHNSVKAIEAVLKARHLGYATLNSTQLNGMTKSQLMAYRLFIVPGGNYITMGNSLTPNTASNVHHSVQAGLNYLGICAGGLLAGDVPSNGLNLTFGARFGFYAAVNKGVHKAVVTIAGVGTPALEHYWEDGPQFAGWGQVVGKYPDGSPAVVQGTSGKGWVVLCGVHPEAPASWRQGMNFTAPASAANAYAGTLIDAALRGTRLPHY